MFSNFFKKAILKAGTIQLFPQKLVLVILALLLICSPLVSYLKVNENPGSDNSVAEAASLSEVQLLTDVTIGAELSDPAAGEPYNLNLNLNGTGLADAELVSPERTVVFHAPELAGQLQHSGGTANVQVDILPVNLEEDLPALNTTLVGLQGTLSGLVTDLLTDIDNALPAMIPPSLVEVNGIDELNTAIDNLNNLNTALADVLSYNDGVQYTVNDDGTIVVSFTDGLGNHLETAVVDVVQSALYDVSEAVNNLEINILSGLPIVGGLLDRLTNNLLLPLVGNVIEELNNISTQLTEGTIPLSNDLASAQIIGNTNVNLDVSVNNPPGHVEGTTPVLGAGIQDSVIDVALLNSLQSQDTVTFPEQVDDIAPVLDSATIEGTSETGYTVSGTGEEPGDTVNVFDSEGNEVDSGVIGDDGLYSVDIDPGTVDIGEELSVIAIDEAGNESDPITIIVPEDPDTTPPILNNVLIEGSSKENYTITGTTEPDAKIIVKDGNNEIGITVADGQGNFSINISSENVQPLDELSLTATDDSGNESEPTIVEVPENQLAIESVPDIVFETTEIKDEEMIIGRQENNSVIDIIDTRKNETWSLTAQVENALQNANGDILPSSFIYMTGGQEIYLEDAAEVATKEDAKTDGVMDRITWSDEEGIFLKTNPIEAVADSEYSTTIEWTLFNGP